MKDSKKEALKEFDDLKLHSEIKSGDNTFLPIDYSDIEDEEFRNFFIRQQNLAIKAQQDIKIRYPNYLEELEKYKQQLIKEIKTLSN